MNLCTMLGVSELVYMNLCTVLGVSELDYESVYSVGCV